MSTPHFKLLCLIRWVSGIRVTPSAGTTGFDDGINSAILRYAGADDADPTTNQTSSVAPLDESDLIVSFLSLQKLFFFSDEPLTITAS